MGTPSKLRPGFLTLTIKDKNILYAAYMSFLQNGGLFIPTNRPYELGQEVSLLLKLLDDPEELPVHGTVVWVTPKGAQNNRTSGIGIQFEGEEGKIVRNKIETYLAGMVKSDKSTYTL